jgi:benzoate-CoA ligase family protein
MTDLSLPEEFNLADYFLFDRLKEGKGTRVAIRFGARAYTYEDVADRTMRLSAALQAAGVRQEERVLVILPDMPPFVWSIMATLKAGAVLTMGNPDAPPEDLAYLVEYTRASAIITLARVVRGIEASRGVLSASRHLRALFIVPDAATGDDPEKVDDVSSSLPAHDGAVTVTSLAGAIASAGRFTAVVTKRDDVAIWLFTSGSTGKSKAAIHTHRDFAFNTEAYAKGTVGYREGDVTVSVPRLFFGYATGTNLFFPFAVGGTTCLFAERPTPETLAAAILRHRPTVVTNVPTMIGKLLEFDAALVAKGEAGLDMSSVRFSLSAGEALPPTLLERYLQRFGPGCARGGGEVYDGIGSAEMFHIYATNRPGDVKPGSLGRAVRGYQIAILPEDAQGPGATPLPAGEIGVMWVRGDSVALAYHQDRDKSWRTFHGRWCCTGDLFRLDAEGYLWFGGRADELLKVSGLWVSPLEVEECLVAHPDVAMAAVIGAAEGGLVKPKAYVVLREAAKSKSAATMATELQAFVKDKLAKHKYPRWIVVVDDLPRNDRGKVDKKALRAREAST